jgi:hypothetical protein
MAQLGICLHLLGEQLSQYANYNFNSVCRFGDKYLGANDSGIFELDSGDDDAGTDIEAFFELLTTDMGTEHQKRIRSVYVGYETNGDLLLTVKDDEDNERHFTLKPNHVGNKQQTSKVPIGRDGKGRYWMFRIDNVNGSDFGINSITAVPVILNRRPAGA